MSYREFPFLHIEVDELTSVITMDWDGTFTSAQFREAVTYCMELVAQKKLKYWLANSSRIGEIQPADQKWSSEVLLPRLSELGVKKVALVIPEDLNSHLAITTIMVRGKEKSTFAANYFVKKKDALDWMLGK
ncbi:hypothetical protein [Rufibacter ruber]|uniref:hypothetical protein n=1 Tax=Rufibacter ruber TaxID=1783499 RepID=UPI00082E9E1A|nr:hypothetical protein [Rufibacter ruber]